jgi:hypothetical protein
MRQAPALQSPVLRQVLNTDALDATRLARLVLRSTCEFGNEHGALSTESLGKFDYSTSCIDTVSKRCLWACRTPHMDERDSYRFVCVARSFSHFSFHAKQLLVICFQTIIPQVHATVPLKP